MCQKRGRDLVSCNCGQCRVHRLARLPAAECQLSQLRALRFTRVARWFSLGWAFGQSQGNEDSHGPCSDTLSHYRGCMPERSFWQGELAQAPAQKDQTFSCTGHGLARGTTCHWKWGEWWAAYLSFTATLDAGPTIAVFPSQDTAHRPENVWLPVSSVGNPQHALWRCSSTWFMSTMPAVPEERRHWTPHAGCFERLPGCAQTYLERSVDEVGGECSKWNAWQHDEKSGLLRFLGIWSGFASSVSYAVMWDLPWHAQHDFFPGRLPGTTAEGFYKYREPLLIMALSWISGAHSIAARACHRKQDRFSCLYHVKRCQERFAQALIILDACMTEDKFVLDMLRNQRKMLNSALECDAVNLMPLPRAEVGNASTRNDMIITMRNLDSQITSMSMAAEPEAAIHQLSSSSRLILEQAGASPSAADIAGCELCLGSIRNKLHDASLRVQVRYFMEVIRLSAVKIAVSATADGTYGTQNMQNRLATLHMCFQILHVDVSLKRLRAAAKRLQWSWQLEEAEALLEEHGLQSSGLNGQTWWGVSRQANYGKISMPLLSVCLWKLCQGTPIATRQSVEGPACKKQRAFAVKSQGLRPIWISKTWGILCPRHPNTSQHIEITSASRSHTRCTTSMTQWDTPLLHQWCFLGVLLHAILRHPAWWGFPMDFPWSKLALPEKVSKCSFPVYFMNPLLR